MTWTRERQLTPQTTTYDQVCEVWQGWAQNKQVPVQFPLSPELLKQAMNPWSILNQRRSHGSASPSLLTEQLNQMEGKLAHKLSWVEEVLRFQAKVWFDLDNALDQL